MPVLPNPRHEAFAQEFARGKTAEEAHVSAGYKRNRFNAANLARKEHIRTRVAEIQHILETETNQKTVVTKAWIIEKLAQNARDCLTGDEKLRNAAAGNRALELLGKELGMFIERRDISLRRISQMSEEELVEFLSEGESEGISGPPAGNA